MDYAEFYRRFGGSYRRKHLMKIPARRLPRALFGLRFFFDGDFGRTLGKVPFVLPPESELPLKFIRLDPWEGEYLFMMASRARKRIVEIGRFYGGSTFLLACANAKVPIHSIDLGPQDDDRLRRCLSDGAVGENLELIVGDSQGGEFAHIQDVDMLFVDGDHSYEGCTRDLENWYPKVVPGGHVLLHDCYFGSPVLESVVDFTAKHDVQLIRSPYQIASHWRQPPGSVAHFVKRS